MLQNLESNTDILLPENLNEIIKSLSPDIRLKNLYSIWRTLADYMSKLEKITHN
jgi:hypothetical protein